MSYVTLISRLSLLLFRLLAFHVSQIAAPSDSEHRVDLKVTLPCQSAIQSPLMCPSDYHVKLYLAFLSSAMLLQLEFFAVFSALACLTHSSSSESSFSAEAILSLPPFLLQQGTVLDVIIRKCWNDFLKFPC